VNECTKCNLRPSRDSMKDTRLLSFTIRKLK
jgi:hypothetical protein